MMSRDVEYFFRVFPSSRSTNGHINSRIEGIRIILILEIYPKNGLESIRVYLSKPFGFGFTFSVVDKL